MADFALYHACDRLLQKAYSAHYVLNLCAWKGSEDSAYPYRKRMSKV